MWTIVSALVMALFLSPARSLFPDLQAADPPDMSLIPTYNGDPIPLRFDVTRLDFGTVSDSPLPVSTIWFRNASTSDVTAYYVEREVGQPCHSTRGKVLKPGDVGHIDVELNLGGRAGEYNKKIVMELEWNCPPVSPGNRKPCQEQAHVIIPITATVIPGILFEPVKMYLMDVPTQTGKAAEVTVSGLGKDFDIRSVTPVNENNQPIDVPVDIVKGASRTISRWGQLYTTIPITLRVPPRTPIGEIQCMLRFDFDGVIEYAKPVAALTP